MSVIIIAMQQKTVVGHLIATLPQHNEILRTHGKKFSGIPEGMDVGIDTA